MKIHMHSCTFRFYYESLSKSPVEKIVGVYGRVERRHFLVRWEGLPPEKDTWEPEFLLLEDGCKQAINEFWLSTGLCPARDFYEDKDTAHRCWVCGWATNSGERYLKTHLTRRKHYWSHQDDRPCNTARKDIRHDKLKRRQQELPKVRWGEKEVDNCYRFIYLGSIFQVDGDHMSDVLARIAMAKQRAGKL